MGIPCGGFKVCLSIATSEDHDSPLRGDREGFDPSYAIRLGFVAR
jgi:hypothetical protein